MEGPSAVFPAACPKCSSLRPQLTAPPARPVVVLSQQCVYG